MTFTMSGAAYSQVADGGWREDNPRGWECVERAPRRRIGRGTQLQITMRVDDANDLADYLWSVAEVVESMSAEERSGQRTQPLRAAISSIARSTPWCDAEFDAGGRHVVKCCRRPDHEGDHKNGSWQWPREEGE